MKIDYDLVERIGATHYNTENGDLYGIVSGYPSKLWNQDYWDVCIGLSDSYLAEYVRRIPPKPQPEFEYVKVEFDSIFDYKDLLLSGELYATSRIAKDVYKIDTEHTLMVAKQNPTIRFYQRIEKPRKTTQDIIDEWEAEEGYPDYNEIIFNRTGYDKQEFINLCKRVVANLDK